MEDTETKVSEQKLTEQLELGGSDEEAKIYLLKPLLGWSHQDAYPTIATRLYVRAKRPEL